jgi:hypothetical protein
MEKSDIIFSTGAGCFLFEGIQLGSLGTLPDRRACTLVGTQQASPSASQCPNKPSELDRQAYQWTGLRLIGIMWRSQMFGPRGDVCGGFHHSEMGVTAIRIMVVQ